MMIEKKTVIDQIEITREGRINIRFALLLVEDGEEIDSKWHRSVVDPGVDVDAQLALVNDHLRAMGKAQVSADDRIADLKAVVPIVHTPKRVAEFMKTATKKEE